MREQLHPPVYLAAIAIAALSLCACEKSEPSATPATDMRGSTTVEIPREPADTVTGPGVPGQPASDTVVAAERQYDVRSGIIRYRNSFLDREQIFYFDGYGAREALYDVVPEGTARNEENPYVAIIHADGKRRMFDLQQNTGRMSALPPESGALLGTIPDVWNKISILKNAQQAQDLPPREVLGRMTEGYQFQATGQGGSYKVWIWNRIPLYAEIRMDEEPLYLEATNVEIDIPIPADRFKAPPKVIFALE